MLFFIRFDCLGESMGGENGRFPLASALAANVMWIVVILVTAVAVFEQQEL